MNFILKQIGKTILKILVLTTLVAGIDYLIHRISGIELQTAFEISGGIFLLLAIIFAMGNFSIKFAILKTRYPVPGGAESKLKNKSDREEGIFKIFLVASCTSVGFLLFLLPVFIR